jgi:hypothetical protein
MEQYWMSKRFDVKNLRMCIDNYEADELYIRQIGSHGGKVQVNESLAGRELDFKKNSSGLHMIVDKKEVFNFPLKIYDKGFSLAYERFIKKEGEYPRMVILGEGIDPYDPKLPEPTRSFLRTVLDDYLMEIYFKGRIELKFHSWWDKKSNWKHWVVDMPKEKGNSHK